jgi:hypothetical protein
MKKKMRKQSQAEAVKKWLTTAECKTPLDVFESSMKHLHYVVNCLQLSLEETLEHFETLFAAMQIAVGKEAKCEPTAEAVESAFDSLQYLFDTEGALRGLNESILGAISIADEWRERCKPDDEGQ